MSRAPGVLLPAVHSAVEELRRARVRFEVFARVGESAHRRWCGDGDTERRASREVGVSCRVAGSDGVGFAASSGSSARAGREAARAALASLWPGVDPLPPRDLLGCVEVPSRPAPASEAELAEAVTRFTAELTRHGSTLRVLDLRASEAVASSILVTGEGFSCTGEVGAGVVEVLLAPAQGPLRHVHWAARSVRDLSPERLAPPVAERALAVAGGTRVRRQLADVVLAPAVAAPLVAALAAAATTDDALRGRDGPRSRRSGHGWHVVDQRTGPVALLPMPCDGEGLPVSRVEVIVGGQPAGAWSTWAQARELGRIAGGARRTSYQDEPTAGPVNLVVLAARRHPLDALLSALDRGFLLDFPAGEVRVAAGAFALRAAALSVSGGRIAAAHPAVELRGSFRRLLAAFEAAGDDDASFSHGCVVTTPSLLLRGLEVG